MEQERAAAAGTGWAERPLGGNAAAEAALIDDFAGQVNCVQAKTRRIGHAGVTRRAFHAKVLAAVADATFEVRRAVPDDLARGLLHPGATWPAIVRLSSASGGIHPDTHGDLRGIAVRVQTDRGPQDLLMTSAPASHARDAGQFMAVAVAMASRSRVVGAVKLAFAVGPREAIRILGALKRATSRQVPSLALEQFWSRAPFALGDVAVKLTLAPAPGTVAPVRPLAGDDFLRDELAARLATQPVTYELRAQRYVDETRTPIEDGTVEWRESDSPPVTVATLTIPAQDLCTDAARTIEASIDALAFNPWNTPGDLHPLGSLNRARRQVYESSAHYRATGKPTGLPAHGP